MKRETFGAVAGLLWLLAFGFLMSASVHWSVRELGLVTAEGFFGPVLAIYALLTVFVLALSAAGTITVYFGVLKSSESERALRAANQKVKNMEEFIKRNGL